MARLRLLLLLLAPWASAQSDDRKSPTPTLPPPQESPEADPHYEMTAPTGGAGITVETGARLHFGRLDENDDGALDRSEAKNAPNLAARFETLDVNHDGTLDPEEFDWHARDSRGSSFAAADLNGDGRVTWGEVQGSALAARFADLDRNGDRLLEPSEFAAYEAEGAGAVDPDARPGRPD